MSRALSLVGLCSILLACSGLFSQDQAYQPEEYIAPELVEQVPSSENIDPQNSAPEQDLCSQPIPTNVPEDGRCAVDEIRCGDVVEGNTSFGRMQFGDEFYQSKYCTPQRNDYEDASDIVYMLHVEANVRARIQLTSDCADLDVAAVAWADKNSCPDARHNISECEMDTSSAGGEVAVATVNRPKDYLVIVDGKRGLEGNYSLQVLCDTYR